MGGRAMKTPLAVFSFFLLVLTVFSTAPALAANDLQLRFGLPQDSGQFIYTYLNNPLGVAVDGSGNVNVEDADNARIQKFDSDELTFSKAFSIKLKNLRRLAYILLKNYHR
jgi:hypothetical protein